MLLTWCQESQLTSKQGVRRSSKRLLCIYIYYIYLSIYIYIHLITSSYIHTHIFIMCYLYLQWTSVMLHPCQEDDEDDEEDDEEEDSFGELGAILNKASAVYDTSSPAAFHRHR